MPEKPIRVFVPKMTPEEKERRRVAAESWNRQEAEIDRQQAKKASFEAGASDEIAQQSAHDRDHLTGQRLDALNVRERKTRATGA